MRVILLSNHIMAFVTDANWEKREDERAGGYSVIGNVYRLAVPFTNPTDMKKGWRLKGALIAADSEIHYSSQNVVFSFIEAESETNSNKTFQTNP